jgi:hypothetical protein
VLAEPSPGFRIFEMGQDLLLQEALDGLSPGLEFQLPGTLQDLLQGGHPDYSVVQLR